MKKHIALIGEFRGETFQPQTSMNRSLEYLQRSNDFRFEWIDTDMVETRGESILGEFDGFWSAPGSPFRSLFGALRAIQFARTNNLPHLGTCAGFQHGVIELARGLLNMESAQSEEYDASAPVLFVSKLNCSLVGKTLPVNLQSGSKSAKIYNEVRVDEEYYCQFGLNPDFAPRLNHPDILIAGTDDDGEIRILELRNHPFFVLTLFVPQTRWVNDHPHPLVEAFVRKCCD